jgi:hypothetical protein
MKRVAFILLILCCTPAEQQHARNALDVAICVESVALKYVDLNLKDTVVLAKMADEVASTCTGVE